MSKVCVEGGGEELMQKHKLFFKLFFAHICKLKFELGEKLKVEPAY